MSNWQPIETAPKKPDSTGLTQKIILGFAPDEEDWTLESCEGHWSPEPWKDRGPCFVSSVDPDDPQEPAQPTHWMPLPDAPGCLDWSKAPNWARYAAMTAKGDWWWHSTKPTVAGEIWSEGDRFIHIAKSFEGPPFPGNFRDSLQQKGVT